jgi:hypothetical protein
MELLMTWDPTVHITAEDLDLLLAGTPPAATLAHLAGCRECRQVAARDRAVVVALARLPRLEPSPGFADRVMARIGERTATRRSILRLHRTWPAPRLAAAAAALLAVAAGMTGSVIWSVNNSEALLAARVQTLALFDGLAALGRSLIASPVALAGSGAVLLAAVLVVFAVWTASVIMLRRLVALPRTAHAA